MWDAVKIVLSENWNNRQRMLRLASYELKSQNYGTVFGSLWNILNPALQILTYWFVFAIGLRQDSTQDGVPYIIWMIVGLIPWFFISATLQTSTLSIYSYAGILKRMKFPMAIVPVKTVFAQFFAHLLAMLVMFAVMIFAGVTFSLKNLQLFYFMFCSICFLVAFSLMFSAVTVLFKDFQKILSSVIRLLFYITPIVWNTNSLPEHLQNVLKLNPLYYLVEGYRESLISPNGLWVHKEDMCYFWCVTILLFLFGCKAHVKFRRQFIDLL